MVGGILMHRAGRAGRGVKGVTSAAKAAAGREAKAAKGRPIPLPTTGDRPGLKRRLMEKARGIQGGSAPTGEAQSLPERPTGKQGMMRRMPSRHRAARTAGRGR